MQRWCLGLVCMLFAFVCVAPLAAQDASVQAPTNVVYVTGQVVGEDGQPIAGAGVVAAPRVMGNLLNSVRGPDEPTGGLYLALSDEHGRFKLPVPYAGIAYHIQASFGPPFSQPSYGAGLFVVASEGDEAIELVLVKRSLKPQTVTARLFDETGDVLANQMVRMTCNHGKVGEGRTDANGVVTITHDWRWRPDLLVQAGDWVTFAPWPKEVSKDAPMTHELTLTRGASLRGRLHCNDLGEPLDGAQVIVTLKKRWDKPWRITTRPDGRFELNGLPPGEYRIRAVAATHSDRPTRDRSYFKRSLTLKPGEETLVPADMFDMQPVAKWRGRVVDGQGNPVAGAMVGCRSRYLTWYDNIEAVYTDEAGSFEITCGYFEKQRHPLMAYYPEHGLAAVELPALLPGETGELGDVVLAGATRIVGTVTDREDKPLAGIGCRYREKYDADVLIYTDDEGRYDLGWVPLARETRHSDKTMEVLFFGKLWGRGTFAWLPKPTPPGSRVVSIRRAVERKPGETTRLDAQVQRTDRLDFHGQVLDEKGKPMKGARVYLLPGKVLTEKAAQRDAVATFIDFRDEREVYNNQPSQGHGGFYSMKEIELPEGKQMPRELSVTQTDAKGQWFMSCLRVDSDASLVRLGQFWTAPLVDDKTPPRPKLQWVTVLVAWGEIGKVKYRLHEPVQVQDGKAQYEITSDL